MLSGISPALEFCASMKFGRLTDPERSFRVSRHSLALGGKGRRYVLFVKERATGKLLYST